MEAEPAAERDFKNPGKPSSPNSYPNYLKN